MKVRGPGRPWHEKLRAKEKRTVLVGLRITPQDEKRLKIILQSLPEDEQSSASTYAYEALLKAIERHERKLIKPSAPNT